MTVNGHFKKMQEYRIATWNIRKCIGLDRRRDPYRVARVIASMGADIVALQEADKRLGQRPAALSPEIVSRETGLEVADAGGNQASIGWHGNALLLRPGIDVLDRHNLDLPGLEPRGCLVFDLEGAAGPLRVVGVHLGLIRQSRRAQIAAILAHLDELAPLPTVILGDFNEWSRSRGLEHLSGYEVHSPGNSFHTARPVASLDRIAVGGNATLLNAGVLNSVQTRHASDHLPVWGHVSLPRPVSQTTTSISAC